jgi:signal transduction histidine kinase
MRWTFAGIAGFGVLATTMVLLAPGATIDMWPVALAFWCTLVLGSGVMLLVAWRVGGWARPGRLGATLVALALLVSVLPRLSEVVASIESLRDVRPLGTTVALVLAVGHVGLSLPKADVDTAVRPLRELFALMGLMVLGVLASVTVLLLVGERVQDAIEWGPAMACLVGACVALVAGRHESRVVARAVASAFLLMALASAVRHASAADAAQALATAAMCTSAWLFVGIARDRLRRALAMQDGRSLQTLATLDRYSTQASRERERRHDALNALAAIRSAADVLTTRGQHLDSATRTELSLAARAELARVERMLAPPGGASSRDSLLAEVLRPLLLARRHRGLVIEADLGDVQVRAVPDIVARIIGNLLQNVERHAGGSGVRLVAQEVGDEVHIRVSDSGPGIPAECRSHVFDAGVTSYAHGQGLGLPSALRLARDQGGDLRLASSETGCCFVLTLPSAASAVSGSTGRPMHAQVG